MSPRSTFQSCGISSSCDAFSQRPIARVLGLGQSHELLAEVRPEPRLGVALQRAELEHREEAAVRGRRARRGRGPAGRSSRARRSAITRATGSSSSPKTRREEDVERAQLDVGAPPRRLGGEPRVAADQRVLELRGHGAMVDLRRWRSSESTTSSSPRRRAARRRRARSTATCSAWRSCRSPSRSARRGGVWFARRRQELHVGVEEPFAPARKAHPGLVVDDLDAMRARLRRRGHPEPEDDARSKASDAVLRPRPVREPLELRQA